jgi:glucose-6-phosphate 1-dehydrogenase
MDNFSLVIIGITSNLAQIKLIPTLYDLIAGNYLPKKFQLVGVGRTPMDRAEFELFISKTLRTPNRHHTHKIDETIEKELFSRLTYLQADLTNLGSYTKLKNLLATHHTSNHMFYLATFPSLYGSILKNLKSTGLADAKNGWTRLLLEKPIGSDRDSARELNKVLTNYFREDQIFRLDHYLGKETLQNILTFRFGNGILEPLMNREHIDHIQVTASEDFGIGNRGNYYDQNGAIKDVGQNHVLQMLALSTMDAPVSFSDREVTHSRVNLLNQLIPEPESLVIGQYEGYQNEKDIAQGSRTETYFAFKTHINNNRFKGVPIYVRGGKCLTRTATEIAIIFKNPANRIFSHLKTGIEPNILIYRIQPNEGIVLKIMTKKPGHELILDESYMQYCYPHDRDLPDAYERLIVDALKGDQTFFNDANEVDAQWKFTDSLISSKHKISPSTYKQGSWGPVEAEALMTKDGRAWYEPSTSFCSI